MNAYEILIELEPRNIEIISINAETNTVTVDVTRSTFKDATMIERILFSNTGNLYHVETIEQKEDETMKTNTLTAEELALLEEPEKADVFIRGCLYGEAFESVIADYMLNN